MAQESMEGHEGSSKASGKRSSQIWEHFDKDESSGKATCKTCKKQLCYSSSLTGTNSLWRHHRSCSREEGRPAKLPRRPPLPAPGPGESSSAPPTSPRGTALPESSLARPDDEGMISWFDGQEDCGTELARMIAFHGYPSSIVEESSFRSFVHGLNPHFQMPSRAAVEGIFHRHVEDALNQLKDTLRSNSGEISLAMGTEQTVQGRALYMACQFIDDEWALQKRIMQVFAVVPFPPYHHGTLLGAEEVSIELNEGVLEQLSLATTSATLKEAVVRWGLPGRLFSVAWGEELEEHLQDKEYLNDLHQVNPLLVYDVPRVFCVTYTSDVLNSVAETICGKLDNSYSENCFKAVKALTLTQEQRDQCLSDLGLKHLGRYGKRWFSYYCALEMLHKVYSEQGEASGEPPRFNETQIGELLRRSKHKQGQLRKLLGLSRFEESQLTELLRKILGMIYRAIVKISSPSRATSNLCLQELVKLRAVLESEAKGASTVATMVIAYAKAGGFARDHDVRSALQEAQGEVEKFLQDSHRYLPIPVVLDPRFKLEYITDIFKQVFGSDAEDRVSKVLGTMQNLFTKHESKRRQLSGEGTSDMDRDAIALAAAMDLDPDMELARYLQDSTVPIDGDDDSFDVLQWWKANSLTYPTVASIARDALAMPTSDMLSPEHISRIRGMMCNQHAKYSETSDD
ncbi:hypothetical protein ACP4OV_018258 [Aristida adscensionis]